MECSSQSAVANHQPLITNNQSSRRFDRLCFFLILNYFAQGMAGIIYEPISYLMKDGLGLSAGQSSSFLALMTLPFLAQPLWGLISDGLPIGGLRRKPHLLIFSFLTWAALAALACFKAYSYWPLLSLLFLGNIGLCGADVVCGAVSVERGLERDKTGLYQSVKIATMYGTLIASGLGAGWLAAHVSYRSIFLIGSIFPLLMAASVLWVEENSTSSPQAAGGDPALDSRFRGNDGKKPAQFSRVSPELSLPPAPSPLTPGLFGRRFWLLAAFLFLWSFYPFLGTAQFYYQSEGLKLGPVFIGALSTLGGVAGFLGAAFYGRFYRGASGTRTWVTASVWLGGLLSLAYLFYLGPWSAAFVTVLSGFAGVAFRLSLIDLSAQSCPKGFEATAFAFYMVVFDLAAWASNAVGGKLYDFFLARLSFLAHPAYGAMAALSLIGTACTFSCAAFLGPLFPEKKRL